MKTLILNHKSYMSYEEIVKYKDELNKLSISNIDLVLFPNIAYLSLFKNTNIKIGSQNFYSYNFGSYTGEISLETLKSLDINHTLLGHPERLTLKLDTYAQIKDKLFRSLNSGFKTILCLGHDENIKMLKKELKFFFKGIEHSSLKNLIIAFEPSSKIEGDYIDLYEIEYIRNLVKSYMNKEFDLEVPFLYGGSVNKENINDILKLTDGVILGKTSTDINIVKEIISIINE